MNIDSTLQNHVLHFLKSYYDKFLEARLIYSACIDGVEYPDPTELFDDFFNIKVDIEKLNHLQENLTYLSAHGLLEKRGTSYRITHTGIDFIEDDGGLSAILNVSTVKLHPSSAELLISVIDGSSLNPSDKQKMIDQLKSLPADAIKQILTELVNRGVGYLPSLFS